MINGKGAKAYIVSCSNLEDTISLVSSVQLSVLMAHGHLSDRKEKVRTRRTNFVSVALSM